MTTKQHYTSQQHPGSAISSLEQEEKEPEEILLFALSGVLPESQRLALHRPLGILALLSCEQDLPCMLAVQQFTLSELCVLIPLLEAYPDYCPHEVLLACFNNGSANVTEETVVKCRRRLHAAHMEGFFDQEMRPVRNVLSRTRLKLHEFAVDVTSLLETGYLIRAKSMKLRKSQPN
jgi:hypothetical protein